MAQPINLGKKTTFVPTYMNKPMEEREAYPIIFPGFEEIEFRIFKMSGCWEIYELSTGLRLTGGHGSKNEANDKAIYILGVQGLEKTKLAIKRALENLK